ncbi:acyltransferase family protein [Caulobacter endophyticus]|uniref:acyltransferase family protein n=1 Tax=Caulobacter endophyticus TaxID=2172652 RepID=UPI00240F8AC4|nr:acyltransferase [Caulobacter endophyticus]MDG2531886.1 acyltransferase [Caulobacter endophyticus]
MRISQLDAVRALAIGAVIVEHYGGRELNRLFPMGAGSVGVGLFFCLSGFLITSSLLTEFSDKSLDRRQVWLSFYVRRLLRLAPAYYGWILVLVLLGIEPVASSWPWHAAYLSNVWHSLGNPMLDFWSLAVEEQFYVLWPFVIAFTPRRVLPLAIIATTIVGSLAFKAAAAAAGISSDAIQTLLFSNMTELGFGGLLAVSCLRRGKAFDFSWYVGSTRRWFNVVALIALLNATVAWYLVHTKGAYRYYFNDMTCAVVFVWIIINASIGFRGVIGRIFDNPVVQYIGRISYGLYLTHNFVPDIIVKYFGEQPKIVLGPASLALSLIICALSWKFYEQPFLKLKDRFRPRRRPTAPPVGLTAESQTSV